MSEDDEILAFTADRSGRIDQVAAEGSGLSRSRVAALIRGGSVWVGDRVAQKPSDAVESGQPIAIAVPPPAPATAVPQDLPISLVFEDRDLAVVDKAAGMVVHPGPGHADGTLVNALLFHLGDLSGIGGVQRPGIVHRLDRGTSGLLAVAKNDATHVALAAQFADKTAGRRYLAIVRAPAADHGTVDAPLGRHPSDRVRFAVVPDGRRAVSHWKVLGRSGSLALVEVVLETGRTHQVRVHLAHIGSPLVGDPLYGRSVHVPPELAAAVPAGSDRPMLHAWRLGLTHPRTGERCTFEAAVPEDFAAVLRILGLTARIP